MINQQIKKVSVLKPENVQVKVKTYVVSQSQGEKTLLNGSPFCQILDSKC
jgi:hypothetical protein